MPEPIDRLNTAPDGRYHLERRLAEGGMATVYLADDLKHERKVPLKVLKPELAAVVGVERFLREIKATANLQHPHILPLFESGEADGFLFYVMPHVQGETLRARLEREGQLPSAEALRITGRECGSSTGVNPAGPIGYRPEAVCPAARSKSSRSSRRTGSTLQGAFRAGNGSTVVNRPPSTDRNQKPERPAPIWSPFRWNPFLEVNVGS